MILLVGENEDSILYFRHRCEINEELELPLNVHAYRGTVGGEELVVASVGVDNMVTCARVSMLIARFHPYIVFNIGTVTSMSERLHTGDVFIADRYYLYGTDFTSDGVTRYGQIPGLPEFFSSDTDVNNQAEASSYAVGGVYVERGSLLSSDEEIFDVNEFARIVHDHYLGSAHLSAYDNNSYGVALACYWNQTSLLTIKAVSYEPDHPEQKLGRLRKGIEASPHISDIIIAILVHNHESI